MKYFGTDGIRGKVNKDINSNLIDKVAKAIITYYKKYKLKPQLIVGNDSRESSDYILAKLASKLLRNGIEIHNVGVCSSPSLAFLTKNFNYPLGLMLSASHNPAEYNGLKFFNALGEKVSDAFEEEFEILMDQKTNLKNNIFCKLKNVSHYIDEYINHLKSLKIFNFPIILDCANGGASEICNRVFPFEKKINNRPNGKNINLNAGCTHIEMLRKLCIKEHKIGFAFDGDADRIHVVNKNGDILNGDKILFILSQYYLTPNSTCVGTIYSSLSLENALKNRNIALSKSDVGDKKVYELMKKSNSILGGEDSGHIILKPFMNTGDGILNAIILSNILSLKNMSIESLLNTYKDSYQLRKNIQLEHLRPNYSQIIEEFKTRPECQEVSIITRVSGTEPVFRLFVEHIDKQKAETIINDLYNLLQLE